MSTPESTPSQEDMAPQGGTALVPPAALLAQGAGGQPGHRARNPSATETVDDLRHDELVNIHKSLARLCRVDRPWWRRHFEWDKIFGAGAILFIGGTIGGGLGLLPFWSANPTHVAKREYIALVLIAGLLGLGCVVARMGVKGKEIESVQTVYESVDHILETYDDEAPNPVEQMP